MKSDDGNTNDRELDKLTVAAGMPLNQYKPTITRWVPSKIDLALGRPISKGGHSMNEKDAIDTAAVHLYDWAQKDLRRELATDCPLLRTIGYHNRSIGAFVAWNMTLRGEDRDPLITALIRRAHPYAAGLRGERLTTEDQVWCKHYYEQTSAFKNKVPPLATADETLPTFRPSNCRTCLDAVVGELPLLLGAHRRLKEVVSCRKEVGNWVITTEFEFRIRRRDLLCEHIFAFNGGKPLPRIGASPLPTSLLLFYGLYSATIVPVPSETDSPQVAKAIVGLAVHFMENAHEIFQ